MSSDYLSIIRNFKRKPRERSEIREISVEQQGGLSASVPIEVPTDTKSNCEKSELCEISTNDTEVSDTWHTVEKEGAYYMNAQGQRVRKDTKGATRVPYNYTARQRVDPRTQAEEVILPDRAGSDKLASEYIGERQHIHQVLGVEEDRPGDYDHKATVAGGIPPCEAALAQQARLALLDWQFGLRCGRDDHQCRECRGIPCRNSTEWLHGDMEFTKQPETIRSSNR